MPVIEHILLCQQALEFPLILKIVATAERLMMIQHDIIALYIVQSLAAQTETQIHVIVCHSKPLKQTSDREEVIPAHHQTRRGDADEVIHKTVSAIIVGNTVIQLL